AAANPAPAITPVLAPTPVTGVPLPQQQQQLRSAFSQTTPSGQSPFGVRSATPAPVVASPSPAAPPAATASAPPIHVNGQMAARLEQMGLTPSQIDGVLALSREVVERVVWEVVPVLAETLIKEEIARLMK